MHICKTFTSLIISRFRRSEQKKISNDNKINHFLITRCLCSNYRLIFLRFLKVFDETFDELNT